MKDSMIPQRKAFAEGLLAIADSFPGMVALDPDVGPSTQLSLFGSKYPDRFFSTGIAEQNTIGMAAGMAAEGLIPWVSAFAVFLVHRSGDQIRNSVAHPGANVKLNGTYAGLPTGRAGATHSSFEDLSIMRSLPNMTIFEPADAAETLWFTRMATEMEGPVYLRTVRCEIPGIFDENHRPAFGKAVPLKSGTDITLVASGMMTARVLAAASLLARQGISADVLHYPVIKPFDNESLAASAAKTGLVLTVENHSIIGGLGSAVCESLAETCPCQVTRLGYQDVFLESGDDEILFDHYGLTAPRIAEAAVKFLKEKKGGRPDKSIGLV
ncbi:MAG: transketolase family protein [Treponema sp.]|jgi:transketolase|nr:transketolase family protein [Treponema sp.]